MATAIKSQQELYSIFINNLQSSAPDLTDINEGSIIDSLAGAQSLAAVEVQKLLLDRFQKTFFNTANDDDLEYLAVDHFGNAFARPVAVAAIGVVTFSRLTTAAGNILIPTGTVLKTKPDANGNVQRFATISPVTITGLSINASVVAQVAGAAGNVQPATVVVIESTLLDSSIKVTNALAMAGGAEKQSDPQYRETIRNKVEAIRGATMGAIEAQAKTVTGVVTATGIENLQVVIPYSIGSGLPVPGEPWFRIPKTSLYIADANGTANQALIDAVSAAIALVRAAGVKINVIGATPLVLNWTAAITLNPSGPNYAELASNPQKLKDSMTQYLNAIPIGSGFSKPTANAAMLAIWGPGGTGDLTQFQTTIPSGDVAATAVQKLVAGVMGIQ
jgi:hypothetical protein